MYNGGNTAYTFSETTEADGYLLLYGEASPSVSDGVLTAEIPPYSLVILAEDSAETRGFMKDNILYRSPVPGSTVYCEDEAFLGFYTTYNGIPELTGLYVNGDSIEDGEGTFRFFRWENMQPK